MQRSGDTRTVGFVTRVLSRIVKSRNPSNVAGSTSSESMAAAGGGCVLQVAQEGIERELRPLEVNFDAVLSVEHPAGQGMIARETEYARAEPHALHDTTHTDLYGFE